MFTNPFLKKDPLVEAVRKAQEDGDMRRQAEALVNEEFGVYSRKAVVRENLAAYDARLEEAYKCMKEGEKKDEKKEDKPKADYSKMREKMVGKGKDLETTRKIVGEAKKLADKDYDKDGEVESPKDEVWGSRLRAAKLAGKLEEVKGTAAVQNLKHRDFKETRHPNKGAVTKAPVPGVSIAEEDIDEGTMTGIKVKSTASEKTKKGTTIHHADVSYKSPRMKKSEKLGSISTHHRGRWGTSDEPGLGSKEAAIDALRTGAAAKRWKARHKKMDEAWEGSKEDKAEDKALAKKHGMTMKQWEKSAADKKHDAKEKMDEAAYSAKAARAGKDIAKRGKMFGKIAKKAGAKYGSMERGKKVAGAILAKIRAKHMHEDSSFNAALESGKSVNEVVSAADLAKSGLTLGQYMNRAQGKTAVKGGHNDPTSSNFKGPATSSAAGQLAKSGIGNMSTGGGVNRTLPSKLGSSSMPSSPSATSAAPRAMPSSLSGTSSPAKQPGDDASAFVKSQGVGTSAPKTDLASAASKIASQGPVTSPVSGPGPTSTPPTASATAPTPSKKEAGAIPKTVAESVQVGDNKYRIV